MSKSSGGFVAARGSSIRNYGEKRIVGLTDDGEPISMRITCADVRNVLGGVHRMVEGPSVMPCVVHSCGSAAFSAQGMALDAQGVWCSPLGALLASAVALLALPSAPSLGWPVAHELECHRELKEVFELSQALRWWRSAALWAWLGCAVLAGLLGLVLAGPLYSLRLRRLAPSLPAPAPSAYAAVQLTLTDGAQVPLVRAPPAFSRKSRFADGRGTLDARPEGLRALHGPPDVA